MKVAIKGFSLLLTVILIFSSLLTSFAAVNHTNPDDYYQPPGNTADSYRISLDLNDPKTLDNYQVGYLKSRGVHYVAVDAVLRILKMNFDKTCPGRNYTATIDSNGDYTLVYAKGYKQRTPSNEFIAKFSKEQGTISIAESSTGITTSLEPRYPIEFISGRLYVELETLLLDILDLDYYLDFNYPRSYTTISLMTTHKPRVLRGAELTQQLLDRNPLYVYDGLLKDHKLNSKSIYDAPIRSKVLLDKLEKLHITPGNGAYVGAYGELYIDLLVIDLQDPTHPLREKYQNLPAAEHGGKNSFWAEFWIYFKENSVMIKVGIPLSNFDDDPENFPNFRPYWQEIVEALISSTTGDKFAKWIVYSDDYNHKNFPPNKWYTKYGITFREVTKYPEISDREVLGLEILNTGAKPPVKPIKK